uniref:Uncharacterized protein LOC104222092 n=1 Tax=Nicotiana sylvestris TaxID=4096 RepID=A0A1U7VUP2_NICSY
MTNDNGNQTVPMVTANASTSRTIPILALVEKPRKFFGIDFKRKLEDDMYNIYSNVETSKEPWIALERKYKTEDAALKKFVAAKFYDYKIVYSKSVITQVQELKVIIHDLLADGINRINTNVESINYTICTNRIFIEGLDNKAAEKRCRGNLIKMGANIVEDTPQNNRKRKNVSRQKSNPSKKRFNENCYNCGKAGRKSIDCRATKKYKKKGRANMVEKHEDIDELCTMLFECNLVGNPKKWWIDYGATHHVCAIRETFATYAPIGPKETLSMGNSATAKIEGCGKIFLKMTFGKVVTLKNILHVPEIRKNLVSAGILIKNGFKCVFVSDK